MRTGKIIELEKELTAVRNAAVAAHIAGDRARAECLTGKAVGMHSTLQIAQRALSNDNDREARGELEGIHRVVDALGSGPKC